MIVFICTCSDLQVQSTVTIDAALLVDQIVTYACATNERGEFCAIAQVDNLNDVCRHAIILF